eukprot:4181235-Amphidinium_carterae.1
MQKQDGSGSPTKFTVRLGMCTNCFPPNRRISPCLRVSALFNDQTKHGVGHWYVENTICILAGLARKRDTACTGDCTLLTCD